MLYYGGTVFLPLALAVFPVPSDQTHGTAKETHNTKTHYSGANSAAELFIKG
jgi:hypothetical protein